VCEIGYVTVTDAYDGGMNFSFKFSIHRKPCFAVSATMQASLLLCLCGANNHPQHT
jgi:hypothetical protein